MTGAPRELHVASLVVRCRPERIAPIKRAIVAMPGAEIPAENAAGKIVVTLEAAGEQAIRHQLEAIAGLPGVLAATLVFHHAEPVAPEPESAPPCSSRGATI